MNAKIRDSQLKIKHGGGGGGWISNMILGSNIWVEFVFNLFCEKYDLLYDKRRRRI